MKERMQTRVNDIEIYYETEGEGPPIILLHGNGEDHRIFDRLTEDLKKDHKVFLIDTRGHGKSGKTAFFHYSDMAEDIAALIPEIGIHRPILYGFSDGGIAGIMLAAKYPWMLSGLIASGANLSPKALKRMFRMLIHMQYAFKRAPLLRLMLYEPDITDDDLAKIDVPVLITAGENDIIPVSHSEHIAEKIRDCRLIIVPKENHASYIVHSDKLFPLISNFIENVFDPGKE